MHEMKDSGVEWFGEIPKHWDVHPVYYYFGERRKKNFLCAEDNLLSLSYGNVVRRDINATEGLLPESFNTYNIVEAGDVIIRPTDLQNDKRSLRTGLVKEHGIITSAYIALKAVKPVNTAYFRYLLHTFDVMKVFYNMGNGVRQGLNFSEFSRLMVFEPPRAEQDAIVEFLDDKCSEIDALTADIKDQIEILEQDKQSVISEAVTKGLNPDVEMKDSGIEWIGEIPADWELERLQWHLEEINVKNSPIQSTQVLSLTNKLGVIPYEEKGDMGNKSKENYSEYKLAYPGTIIANSMNIIIGSVGLSNYFGCVSPVYYVFKPKEKENIRFLNYYFQCTSFQKELRRYANGILEIRLRISADNILKRKIPFPSREEQARIVAYLDNKCAEIDAIIADKKEQLTILDEYKKSLIYEYVTGKKEAPTA